MNDFESVREIAKRLVQERRERKAAHLASIKAEKKIEIYEEPPPLFNGKDKRFLQLCGIEEP